DVVPVHMREKHIEAMRSVCAIATEDVIAEFADPGAQVAQEMLVPAGSDLDAARIAAKGAADREWQLALDKPVDRLRGAELAAASGEERVTDFRAHSMVPERC